MTSDEVTLQVFDLGIVPAAIAYLVLAVACVVLARSYRSWSAWLAAAGFGCMALSSLWLTVQFMITWFAPHWDIAPAVTVMGEGLWQWYLRMLALLLAAFGLTGFAWQRRKKS